MTLGRHTYGDSRITHSLRDGFTLVELMVSMAILTLMASILLVGVAGVTEKARDDRTRTLIQRLNVILADHWQSYRTRRVPAAFSDFVPPAGATPDQVKRLRQRWRMQKRLAAVRELMRMEMPDNREEVFIAARPLTLTTIPATWLAYQQMAMRLTRTATPQAAHAAWTPANEESECLYLILSRINDGDETALSQIRETELADTDRDGMPEIVDGWGRPILFFRWAPGFSAHPGQDGTWGTPDDYLSTSALQKRNELRVDPTEPMQIDEFDPLQVDPQTNEDGVMMKPFHLFPLLVSLGPDRESGLHQFDKNRKAGEDQRQRERMGSPYWVDKSAGWIDPERSNKARLKVQIGTPQFGNPAYLDNIHNQTL